MSDEYEDVEDIIFEPDEEPFSIPITVWVALAGVIVLCVALYLYKNSAGRRSKQKAQPTVNAEEVAKKRLSRFDVQPSQRNAKQKAQQKAQPSTKSPEQPDTHQNETVSEPAAGEPTTLRKRPLKGDLNTQPSDRKPQVKAGTEATKPRSELKNAESETTRKDMVSKNSESPLQKVQLTESQVDSTSVSVVQIQKKDNLNNSAKEEKVPELSPEDRLLKLLSQVLDCKAVLSGRLGKTSADPYTFTIRPEELPRNERITEKSGILFERRFVWESVGQTSFCCRAYQAARAYETNESVTEDEKEVIKALKTKAVETLLTTLAIDDDLGDDGIWSEYGAGASESYKSDNIDFLHAMVGQSSYSVGPDLLHDLLTFAQGHENGVKAIKKVIHEAAHAIKQERFDEMTSQNTTLGGLETLFSQPAFVAFTSHCMGGEIDEGIKSLGSYFELHTLLGPLFSVSTVSPNFPEMIDIKPNPKSPNAPWLELRNFPSVKHEDLVFLNSQIEHLFETLHTMLHKLFVRLIRQNKEITLGWLATLLNMNESRMNVHPETRPNPDMIQSTCTDGFMLNLSHLLLDLSLKVFMDHSNRSKIAADYYTSPSCRLNMAATACLMGGQITRDECLERANGCGLIAKEEDRERYKFHTEIVVLAQRSLFIGFFPARTMFSKLRQILDRSRQIQQIDINTPEGEGFKRTNLLFHLRWEASLMDPELSRKGSQFCLGVSQWLLEVLQDKQQAEKLVSLPQYVVQNLGDWFNFTVATTRQRHTGVLDGMELTPFVDACVNLLRRPELQCGPIASTMLIKALHSFLSADRGTHNTADWTHSWGSSALAHGEMLVFGCPAVQEHLARALISTYINVDVVEGLDVSKDDFDKFSARSYIGELLKRMWERQETKDSIVALCGTKQFQEFLWCVFDFLLFPQHEAFKQLASIKKLEKEMENKSTWQALPHQEREEKMKLLQTEQYLATANNRSVSDLLDLINMLIQHDDVARCFTQDDRLAARAATAFLEFFENLCGPRAGEHKVKDMDKYKFDPVALLETCTHVLLRIADHDTVDDKNEVSRKVKSAAQQNAEEGRELVGRFVRSLALDPTYAEASLLRAVDVMKRGKVSNAGKAADKLSELILQISVIQAENAMSHDAAAAGSTSWQQTYSTMTIDEDALSEQYKAAMTPLMFGQAAILDSHVHRAKALAAATPAGRCVKRIASEMSAWQKDLPMNHQAAVFIRQDSGRMDTLRCIVTGPATSPYAYGCYLFDVFFPPTYPEHAPVIKHLTTGNNTVRFSHNLYEDGKVCLSLLGFAEGSETERWQKDKSSLYQVLLSIQSIILVPDAMYRDPRFEGLRGLEEGKKREAEYNSSIRISSIRYTMLQMLRTPPKGMGVVIRNHFRLVRHALLSAACDWLKECPDQHTHGKMKRFLDELVFELDKLGEDMEEEEEEEEEDSEEEEED